MINKQTTSSLESGNKKKHIFYGNDDNITDGPVDLIDKMVIDYERASGDSDIQNPFEFWKKYEHIFPSLAKLAKKYLSV